MVKTDVSHLVLETLMLREDYSRAVLPYIKVEYFETQEERIVFEKIKKYINTYNALPTSEVISIELNNDPNVLDNTIDFFVEFAKDIEKSDKSLDWLLETTEQFCKDRALYIALEQSIEIAQENENANGLSRGALPQIFQDALNVSFDQQIGHDYIDDAEIRYDFYHNNEETLPFNLEELNLLTHGGLKKKTLNLIMAASGVGKTIAMCDFSSSWISSGKNVLYITMEMAEESISERIDANLMDIEVNNIKDIPKDIFLKNIENIKSHSVGKLVVKEYPTGSANVGHFRFLLQELKQKKGFVPDVICVDYVNICSSARIKHTSANSYTIVKSIAEELRGLAVEFNVPLVSATQTGRQGFDASDISATDVSESIGLVQTADLLLAMISNEDLQNMDQVIFKTVKNRYGENNTYHTIGIDRAKMKLFDLEGNKNSYSADVSTVIPKNIGSGATSRFDGFKL